MRAALILSFALVARAAADPPRAPKLDPGSTPPPPAAAPDEPPARPLPPTATVCQDVAAHRCWRSDGGQECGDGRVFRVVIDTPAEVAAALAQCRAARAVPD
jgi:hypothetical protein